MNTVITKKDRFLGCFLGGAVGDALGYPVEFVDEAYIRMKYGSQGIQTLAQAGEGEGPAVITDDTQMTLFVINGLLYGMTARTNPDGSYHADSLMDDQKAVWLAHQEWLGTQGDTSRMENPANPKMWIYRDSRLHALRAPGGTCLSAIRENTHGGSLSHNVNNSKGCGAVMKAAPLGLVKKYDPQIHLGDYLIGIYKYSAGLGAQTHGHPLGYMSASALAVMLAAMVHYRPGEYNTLQEAILHSFTGSHPACHEIYDGLKKAVSLALDPQISDLDGIHRLGEGWVAEEALYIAVFCAVRYQDNFAQAIRVAVNHKGDSDSTGSICGNILGAWLGRNAVKNAFDLKDLEMRDLIEEVATDFYQAVEHGIPVGDAQWDSKYRCGRKLSPDELIQNQTAIAARKHAQSGSGQSTVDAKPLERTRIDVTCGVLDFDKILADIVVSPTDTRLSGSGGLDRQIHLRAGKALDDTCRTLRQKTEITSGSIHVTPGYDLTARWIAHAVTPAPRFDNGQIVNQQELEFCYLNCLRSLVQEPVCKGVSSDQTLSIAMPLLGTGSLGWPVEISLACAWNAIITFVSEQAGSGWHACRSYQIRLCSTEKNLPLIRPYLQRWSTAFFTVPDQWGYRGDIYLWQELMKQFDHPRTYSQRESLPRFMEMARMRLESIFGETGLRLNSHAYVKELDHGGMSGGGLDANFWLLRGLPLLCENFCQRQLGSFNDYPMQDYVWPRFYKMKNDHCLWHLPEDMHEALIGMREGISVFDTLRDIAQGKHLSHQAVPTQCQPTETPAQSSPLRPVGLRYTNRTKRALKISYEAHKGQVDKGGIPYALHPLHLAEQMETEDEICTALLHDVLEDTDYTEEDLRKIGITEPVLEALRLLTHDRGTPYMEYVIGTRRNPLARKVKQADLLHNSDIDRLDQVTAYDLRQRRKYRIAQAILEDDYYDSVCKHHRKRIPLDDDRRYFLSIFYHQNDAVHGLVPGSVIKYSLDVEKAGDSHYEFSPSDTAKLQQTLDAGYTGIRRSLPEALAQFFETHGEMSFVNLLHQLGIKYQQFHFD